MIFVTVGTQLGFDRLIDAMNEIASQLDEPVVAQVGHERGAGGDWTALDIRRQIAPEAFDALIKDARVVVAHAGIGTILSAQRHRRSLIIVPRQASLREHRNDHQIATARAMVGKPGIQIAWETSHLAELLTGDLPPTEAGSGPSRDALIRALKAAITA